MDGRFLALVLVFLFFSVAVTLVLAVSLRTVRRQYNRARLFEAEGNNKAAAFFYAMVLLNLSGSRGRRERAIREKIRDLWERFGPFDYSDIKEQIGNESIYTRISCEETLRVLSGAVRDQSVNRKKRRLFNRLVRS